MNVACIYDAVRTPRGRGKSDGSLYDIQPVHLVQQVLQQLRERNQIGTLLFDDVILGCVTFSKFMYRRRNGNYYGY